MLAPVLAAAFFLLPPCLASSAVGMAWNTSYTFGPDGPWFGVSIDLQNPNTSARQAVNLIPSTRFVYSWIPTTEACSQDSSDSCGVGGEITWPILDDPAGLTRNRTAGNWSYVYGGDITNVSMGFGNQVIPTATVAAFNASNITYPSGIERGAELGVFYLGGVNLGGDPPDVSCGDASCNPSLYLYNTGVTPSYSHGMTLGSAALGYPGSLVLGGYDTGRAIGPVLIAEQQTATLIFTHSLLDVMIGVETGGNPMPTDAATSGLLQYNGAPVSQPLLVACDPQVPYIFLPSGTTEALAASLPVYLDSKSKYYLWDTSSPLYTKLVTSPAYLGFVFSVTSDSTSMSTVSNITIKVPFMLLNLTLETTVSGLDKDVPYFPIQPMDDTDFTDAWIFGRAFLQSAFWGKNWNQNVSWLAQAPGPGPNLQGLGYLPQDIAPSQTSLAAKTGANLFRDSWAGHWTPLPMNGSSTGNDSNQQGEPSGLSGGAIAGIVIGCVALLALIAVGAFFLLRKKRRARPQSTHADRGSLPPTPHTPFDASVNASSSDKYPILHEGAEAHHGSDAHEGGGDYEMSMRKEHYELPTNDYPRPSELPAVKQRHELPSKRWSDYGVPKE